MTEQTQKVVVTYTDRRGNSREEQFDSGDLSTVRLGEIWQELVVNDGPIEAGDVFASIQMMGMTLEAVAAVNDGYFVVVKDGKRSLVTVHEVTRPAPQAETAEGEAPVAVNTEEPMISVPRRLVGMAADAITIRRDQWQATTDGTIYDCVNELHEAKYDEAEAMQRIYTQALTELEALLS